MQQWQKQEMESPEFWPETGDFSEGFKQSRTLPVRITQTRNICLIVNIVQSSVNYTKSRISTAISEPQGNTRKSVGKTE